MFNRKNKNERKMMKPFYSHDAVVKATTYVWQKDKKDDVLIAYTIQK